jgi:dipeptidase D
MIETYREMYGETPKVQAIHAGLECGIFTDGIPGLDCVSYGPDMDDIHTTSERLYVDSVKRTWDFTLEVLKRLK